MNILKLLAFLRLYISSIFQVCVKHYLSTDIVLITQLLSKKIRQGKTYFKSTSILLKKRCKISVQKFLKTTNSSSLLRANFAPNPAFYAIGLKFSSAVASGVPEEHPYKNKSFIRIGRVLIFGIALLSMFSLSAQTPRKDSVADGHNKVEPLLVGQKVPDDFWAYNYKFYSNGDTLTRTLEYLKGKPIILDFWASWCSPCISSLIETNSFIDQLKKNGSFIAVTFENSKIVDRTWKKNGLQLPCIVEDKLLKQYFPHASVPQVIWIDADEIVRHQTSHEPLSQANLNSFFAGKLLSLKAKLVFDKKLPVLPSNDAEKNGLQYYKVVLKGYQDYLPIAKFSRNMEEGNFSTSFVNIPLITIYRDLAAKLFVAMGEPFLKQNFQIKVNDSVGLNTPYTLDLIIPKSDWLSLNKGMVQVLNSASGYLAEMQKEKRECLVMKRIGEIPKPKVSKIQQNRDIDWETKIKLLNVPLAYACGFLMDQRFAGKYIVNETGYVEKIDLELSVTNDLDKLNVQLAKLGMKLENAVREVNVFVIEKKKAI